MVQVLTKDCHLIREGAPVPPEPPIGNWKPEVHVSVIGNYLLQNNLCSYMYIYLFSSFIRMVLELKLVFVNISIELMPINKMIVIRF